MNESPVVSPESTSLSRAETSTGATARASRRLAPTATYRLQFHRGFTFKDAHRLIPYLAGLGISHVYASPIFRATPGSMHGYDVCDHNELNPEIGTREHFDALVAELQRHGMKLVVDFVPNHMGIAEPQNKWWLDVLENGPSSPYARFFDIDWRPLKRELENKVLLPILGDQYGRVLERGEFRIEFAHGLFTLCYSSQRLPLAPRSTRPLLEAAARLLTEPPAELESIITALGHLPERTEIDPGRLAERVREKGVIRERLARLVEEQPAVKDALAGVLASLHEATRESWDRLDELINDQPYRLSSWKTAAEEINYRRFFDVNTLAAIRMELPEVFEHTHRLLLELIAAGAVQGVRIDHIDGLAFPRAYLEQLQASAAVARGLTTEHKAIYMLVEKILGAGEQLRADWPVHGTTGYEFASLAAGVLVDRSAEEAMSRCYERFIGMRLNFREVVYRGKRLVMEASMASEVNVLGHLLNRLSESNRWYRDFTVNALTAAVRELIACFPVYRSYLQPGTPASETDSRLILRALAQARRRNPALEHTVFEFLRDVLLPPADHPHPVDEALRAEFVLKFQQCTGPITAKGVEDTAFYVYHRLVALNEVGGDPGAFGTSVADFHQANATRLSGFPDCPLATSTHDTKRSEDVRARLAALSEFPAEWALSLRRWRTLARKHKRLVEGEAAPDANEEYLFYQTLLGSWPLAPFDDAGLEEYTQRIRDYMIKALHEAKVNSSWIEPNQAWDTAVGEFVERMLGNPRFIAAVTPLARRVAECGMLNSLTQTLLRLTCPGVPDQYQGSEIWDFSLVDPDNRRPVDFTRRQQHLQALAGGAAPAELLTHWRDGRIKMFLMRTLLRFRGEHPELLARGTYRPLAATGFHAECCLAFERALGRERIVIATPRLSSRLGFPATGTRWQDTALPLPAAGGEWRDLFTGATHPGGSSLPLAEVLADFPAAALIQVS